MRLEDIEKLAKETNSKISYILSAYDGQCSIVDIKPIEKKQLEYKISDLLGDK